MLNFEGNRLLRQMRPLFIAVFIAIIVVGAGTWSDDAAATAALCPERLAGAPDALQPLYREFRQSLEDGPFYGVLFGRLGSPRKCVVQHEGEAINLSYTFAQGGLLAAQRNPSIEFTEQRLALKGLKQQESIDLLRAAESAAFSKDGCGIAWDEPVTEPKGPGSHDIVFRGDVCNCQARVTYKNNVQVALLFRSAC
jgi:hypothetical protein